jgi:hypothetical protein
MAYLQSDIFMQSNKTIRESIEACRKPGGRQHVISDLSTPTPPKKTHGDNIFMGLSLKKKQFFRLLEDSFALTQNAVFS